MTGKAAVLSQLKRKWVDFIDLETTTGLVDPMRRVRELRAEGFNVVKRYNAQTGTYQYHIKK